MSMRWEGDNLLVGMSGILQYCCGPPQPPATSLIPPLNAPLSTRLVAATGGHLLNPHPWLNSRTLERPRFTILPTISIVSPWDDEDQNTASNSISDQAFGDSNQVIHILTPTPVLPATVSTADSQPSLSLYAAQASQNATNRFYDVLRAVLHGGDNGSPPALREEIVNGVETSPAGVSHHTQDSPSVTSETTNMTSPILQVCAVLAVAVVIMVLLFHSHHFRRECLLERRALRRVSRRYKVSKPTDDVEKNEEPDVTDVTL